MSAFFPDEVLDLMYGIDRDSLSRTQALAKFAVVDSLSSEGRFGNIVGTAEIFDVRQ